MLVTEIAHDGTSLVAHTKGYVQVLLRHEPTWMGCQLRVRVTETAKFFVRAEVLHVLHEAPSRDLADEVVSRAIEAAVLSVVADRGRSDVVTALREDATRARRAKEQEERGFQLLAFWTHASKAEDGGTRQKPGVLCVRLHGAVELAAADSNGLSDPYVKLTVTGMKGKKHAKSHVIDKVRARDAGTHAHACMQVT